MKINKLGAWLQLWHYGSFAITKPQGRFFLKIDRTGIEVTPCTARGYYIKRSDR